jgi:thioredoxin 1
MAADMAVNTADFEEKVLKSDQPVLVDFWAEWCGPCRRIAPDVEALATEMAGQARVYKLNVDTDPDIASRYGVMSIPALMVFKGGQVVDTLMGAYPKSDIARMLAKHIQK